MIKNTDLSKKSETNLNRNNSNQRSFNNLKVSAQLENLKFPNTMGQSTNSNNYKIRTSSNFNKQTSAQSPSNLNKKTSENFLVKNNNNPNLFINNNGSNTFERAPFPQFRQEQSSKTGSSTQIELISPETERITRTKMDQFRKIL